MRILCGARAQFMPFAHNSIQPLLGLAIGWKTSLFFAKCRGVIIAPAIDYSGGMLNVQHFVKDDVFDEPRGNIARIQGLADRNGFVRGVVMAEDAAGLPLRPGERRLCDLPVEVALINARENLLEIVNLSLG